MVSVASNPDILIIGAGLAGAGGWYCAFKPGCTILAHAKPWRNGGWYDNVPLHASFDQARVAHDRG